MSRNVTNVVAVFGSSTANELGECFETARLLGRAIAEIDCDLATGGYGGVMKATSRGAHEAGATRVIGVVSGATFPERPGPNTYVSEIVEASDILERTTKLVNIADVYVVVEGGIGTLAELFLVWTQLLVGVDKPVIVIGPRLKKVVNSIIDVLDIPDSHVALLHFVGSVNEASRVIVDVLDPGAER